MMIINFVQMANYKLNSKDKITYIQYTIQSSLSQHCYTLLTVKSKSPINTNPPTYLRR